MKKYAFIQNGIVTGIIEGKDDNSRDWAEYYGNQKGMLCKVIPDIESVGVGFKYENDAFVNPTPVVSEAEQLEKWRESFKVELYKLKIQLDTMNDLASVETIIASQPKQVRLAWENANMIRRNSNTVIGLGQAMSYTETQLDDIFKNANDIEL